MSKMTPEEACKKLAEFEAIEAERGDASEKAGFVLGDAQFRWLRGGLAYHNLSCDGRPYKNNFEDANRRELPNRECHEMRVEVHLWSDIDARENVLLQAEEELRKMAKYLTKRADELIEEGRQNSKLERNHLAYVRRLKRVAASDQGNRRRPKKTA